LFISSQGVLMGGPAAGPRMGIVSMSGGACSIVADACVSSGIEVPVLDEQTQSLLRQIVPSFGTVSNPVDVTATGIWRPSLVREVVSVLLDCEAVDAVLVQLSTNTDPGAQAMAADLTALWRTAAKPLLVGRIGASALAPQALQIYAAAGMHIFAWPEQLVRAAVTTVEFGRQSGVDVLRSRAGGARRIGRMSTSPGPVSTLDSGVAVVLSSRVWLSGVELDRLAAT
jgi:acyl-CoA synthetase (NDP forming)